MLLWRTRVPDLRPPRLDPTSVLPSRILSRARRHEEVLDWLWVALTVAQLVVLVALARAGPRLARALPGPRLVRAVVVGGVVVTAAWAATIPVRAVGHWWQEHDGLTHQSYGGWLVDRARELGGTLVVAFAVVALVSLLAARLGRRWWLPGAAVVVAAGAGVLLVGPVLTSDVRPLRDPVLLAEVERLARSEGAGEVSVDVERASRQTTLADAEAIGLGPTSRIVLWDTLLDGRYTHGEIRFVAAHEVAHIARRHVWKGLAWFALLAVPLTWLLARVADPADPAQVARAVLVVFVMQLALLPVANAISRRYEAEADWLGIRATHDPASARALFRRFARLGLEDPSPPGWVHFWLDTHPTPLQRVETTYVLSRAARVVSREGSGFP